ncbi:MAG: hypothetical protein RL351_957 [Actinomycetota bacterium]
MSFAAAVGTGLKKYVEFRGVANRREYWFFILFIVLLTIVTGQLDQILYPELTQKATDSANALFAYLETNPTVADWSIFNAALSDAMNSTPISNFVGFATFFPLLTVTVRRMRDAGFGGWWLALVWVQLFTFIVCLRPSKPRQ